MEPTFQLFSSLRYDPLLASLAENTAVWSEKPPHGSPFYMLPYHRDRMLQAAEHFGWTAAASRISGPDGLAHMIAQLSEAISTPTLPSQPRRMRVLLDQDGTITVEATPIHETASKDTLFPEQLPPPRLDGSVDQATPEAKAPWAVLVDPSWTNPSSETAYKTTSRDMYTEARQRAGIKTFSERKEVLLVSRKEQEIMEGSLTSVYFWRAGTWTTPPVSSGGQIGTTRRWALEKGLCVEGIVTTDSLRDGEECWISNGVRGFNRGSIKLS